MQRRKILKSLVSLALAERLISLRSAWAAGSKLAKPGIQSIKGEVRLNGKVAQSGMLVKPGDTISTGPRSEVIYVIGQDAYLQRDNSIVSLAGDTVVSALRVLNGKLMAVFAKGNKQIETGTATIGIRGTGCYIESAPERVYFCLCYGVAEVSPKNAPGKTETIRSRYHDHPIYLDAAGERMMVPGKVINHTDAELIMLEQLVGRLPPFAGSTGYSAAY